MSRLGVRRIMLFHLRQGTLEHVGHARRGIMRQQNLAHQLDALLGLLSTFLDHPLGKSPRGKVCNGMKGVLEEGAEVLEETEKGSAVRDAALISAAQRVEHYEMAGYGCVREYATLLGQQEIAKLLDETLAEEKAADSKLGEVAKQVNPTTLEPAEA